MSNRRHLSRGDCLEDKGGDFIRTVVHSQKHTHMSSSYRCTRPCWFRFSFEYFVCFCVFLPIWGQCVSLFCGFCFLVYFFIPQMYSQKQTHMSSSYWCSRVCWFRFSFEYFVCFYVLHPHGVTVSICFVVFVLFWGGIFSLFGVIALNIVSKVD